MTAAEAVQLLVLIAWGSPLLAKATAALMITGSVIGAVADTATGKHGKGRR